MGARAGGGKGESVFSGDRVSVREDEKVLVDVRMVALQCECH